MIIKVGVVGSAGYTGGEMIRLLLRHPYVKIQWLHSNSQAGKLVTEVHADLLGDTDLTFTNQLSEDVDLVFLCLGHGEARKFLEQNPFADSVRIIDLSQDFRLADKSDWKDTQFVYGLPELNRQEISKARYIANPGCFATALQLALLPLAKSGLLTHEVNVTGITGATGAGQSLQQSSHFAWRTNNIQAYKSLTHQHLKEVMESLRSVGGEVGPVWFMPWRGDFARGIYISAYISCDKTLEETFQLYEGFYRDHPFTHVSRKPIDLKQAVNTNKCLLYLEYAEGKIIIHAAIDNLLKGASGQAVQNMNLMFGLPEDAGLNLKSIVF